jgi:primosomal protein N' (replication factor Y) (superfamily II helicase)
MQLVEVIPISRAISKESLSYFTSKKILPGSIVFVPLRGKKVNALVLDSKEVSSSKSQLRSSEYSIKKITENGVKKIFLPEFIKAAKSYADFSASSTGAVLYSLIPKILLEESDILTSEKLSENNGDIHQKYIIQAGIEDRFADYKSIIREQIAKKKSVILLSPTSKLAESSFNNIQKGIGEYCYLIHSSLKKSELKSSLKKIIESKKPVIISTTVKFLSIPRSDIGAIIVEKENSSFYKSKTRPFFDARIFSEYFSKEIGAKLFFSDLYLRTETLWRFEEEEFLEFKPINQRVTSSAKQIIVDMKAKSDTRKHTSKGFKIASPQLEKIIKKSIEEKKKLFLFSARLGLNPLTVCGDCGESVWCERCNSPLVLHSSGKRNFFLCHKCGRTRDAETRCKKCHSWKLVPLGIGIELIEKKLKEHFKGLKVLRIDGDSTPTPAKAQKVADDFYEEKEGILLGTEMAVNYLDRVDYSGVVSIDSFFSIPDFRINEKIINLLLSIKEKTREEFLIQTRDIEHGVLDFVKNGNLAGFYRSEIKQRKDFGFPPFFDFIKITFSGKKDVVVKDSQKLKEFFEGYEVSIYPGFVSVVRGQNVVNALIRVSRGEWPQEDLKEKILALPQKFAVDVNPDSLL